MKFRISAFFSFLSSNSNTFFPLRLGYCAASLAAVFAFSSQAMAAPSSRWNQRPEWADNSNDSGPAPTQKRSYAERGNRSRLSPFSPNSHNVALAVGQVFMMGDLGKYNDNIGGQLQYTYGVSNIFGFNADLGYSSHSNGQFSQTSLLTGLRTNLSAFDKVIPYLKGGLGFYRQSEQLATNLTINPMLFGIHIGPGVDLEINQQMYFGASLTFHDIFNSTTQTALGPRTVGGTYTTFFLHLGTTF